MNKRKNSSRRTFLKQSAALSAAALLPACAELSPSSATAAPQVAIVWNPADPVAASEPAQWAMKLLAQALQSRNIAAAITNETPKAARLTILATGAANTARPAPESLTIASTRGTLHAAGFDPRGLTYALTDLADRVRLSTNPLAALQKPQTIHESPANPVRSVMRLFVSDVEDTAWFHDRDFWSRYLDLLAASRFNRFNLALGLGYDNNHGLTDTYFFFAYPYLVSPQGYDVRATGVSDDEREKNLASLRYISDETARRGLDFQLGIWTHAYTVVDSPRANHLITGLTEQTHAPYCRDALHLLLEKCPNISGVTFRVHGESGIPEGSYDLWKTVFDGLLNHGNRRIRLDMHAKGMDQPMIDTALSTKLPVTLSPKFWAEHLGLPYHQAAIREQEMPKGRPATGQFALSNGSRSFLRYGYGDLLKKDRPYKITHRIWPGSNRFLLTADPLFAAAYGRCLSFAGTDGFEIFDPLSFKGRQGSGKPGHRTAYTDDSHLQPPDDHEKFLLTYRTYGRLGYNPDSPADVYERQYRSDFGSPNHPAAKALATASRILPLVTTAHLPSAANLSYWPEIYTNMSLVDPSHPGSYTDTPTPRTFLHVSPLDPQLFSSISEHVDAILAVKPLGKISPAEVADQLNAWASATQTALANTTADTNPATRRAALDASILALTGQFFAHKLRAGLLLAYYAKTADAQAHTHAIDEYKQARAAWASIIALAGNNYVPDITFGPTAHLRGHWSDRLPAIDADIAAVQKFTSPTVDQTVSPPPVDLVLNTRGPLGSAPPPLTHTPPPHFTPGQDLLLSITPTVPLNTLTLFYRHANQAERWQQLDLSPTASTATIPAAYTDSPYPLQYYFQATRQPATGDATTLFHSRVPIIIPGFSKDFTGQPYVLLMPA